MAKPTKSFDNKYHYDSGRLRHKVQCLIDVVTDDGYGGSFVSSSLVIQTWAGKEEVSQYTQSGLNAGQTQYNYYQYFIIRKRNGFTPRKDINLVFEGKLYIIQSVKEMDDPCNFLRLLCVAQEDQIILSGIIYAGGSTFVPIDEAGVKSLSYNFTNQSTDFTFNTGLNRIFSIAMKNDRSIISVYDQTSDEDVTGLYIKGSPIVIDGLEYDIYTMQNAVEFTTAHNHRVKLS